MGVSNFGNGYSLHKNNDKVHMIVVFKCSLFHPSLCTWLKSKTHNSNTE